MEIRRMKISRQLVFQTWKKNGKYITFSLQKESNFSRKLLSPYTQCQFSTKFQVLLTLLTIGRCRMHCIILLSLCQVWKNCKTV